MKGRVTACPAQHGCATAIACCSFLATRVSKDSANAPGLRLNPNVRAAHSAKVSASSPSSELSVPITDNMMLPAQAPISLDWWVLAAL